MDITITMEDNDTGAKVSRRKYLENGYVEAERNIPEDMQCTMLEDMVDYLAKEDDNDLINYQEHITRL